LRKRYGKVTNVIEIVKVSINLAKNTGITPFNDHPIKFCYLSLDIYRTVFSILEIKGSSNHTKFICVLLINTVLLWTAGSVDFGLNRLLKPIEVPTGEEGIG
jgi:hypothetical protein